MHQRDLPCRRNRKPRVSGRGGADDLDSRDRVDDHGIGHHRVDGEGSVAVHGESVAEDAVGGRGLLMALNIAAVAGAQYDVFAQLNLPRCSSRSPGSWGAHGRVWPSSTRCPSTLRDLPDPIDPTRQERAVLRRLDRQRGNWWTCRANQADHGAGSVGHQVLPVAIVRTAVTTSIGFPPLRRKPWAPACGRVLLHRDRPGTCQHQHPHRRLHGPQGSGGDQPAHRPHLDIHQHHVRLNLGGGIDHLLTGRTLPDHLDVVTGAQQCDQLSTHKVMVVNDQDTDHLDDYSRPFRPLQRAALLDASGLTAPRVHDLIIVRRELGAHLIGA